MLVSLTVGKVDAGVAVLLTEDKRLIEFPSILLPPDIHSGSIVDINVSRNQHAELIADQKFAALQNEIYNTFGTETPSPPVLRCRNATQTSVVLEWDPIHLASAELRSLSLYRNGTKAGVIPRDKLSTKISGLALDTEYTFHLVLRTSAGQYSSERLTVKTHKMTDLTGITITPGILPQPIRDSLGETVAKIGAKLIDGVRIDTTHLITTEPRGAAWEKAVEMNIPVVVPDWILGCQREGRIVGVRGYYLNADPKHRQLGPTNTPSAQVQAAQRLSMRDSPRIEHTPPTPERATHHDPARANGHGAPTSEPTTSEPPTPPPKPVHERVVEDGESADGRSVPGTTLAGRESSDADEEGDESDDTERASQSSEKPVSRGKSRMPLEQEERRDVVAEQEAMGDDGKFDEVAL